MISPALVATLWVMVGTLWGLAALRVLSPVFVALLLMPGCNVRFAAQPDQREDYLRYVACACPLGEDILLRWPTGKMPLKIYLPSPPDGLFDDPHPIQEAARAGIVDWTNAGGPGIPSFTFVESAGEADIPVAWAEQSPSYSVAHFVPAINLFQRRFGAAQILVTGRYRDGKIANPEDIRLTIAHEMGHALGMMGHSPNPEDVMYPFLDLSGSNQTWFSRTVLEILGPVERGRASGLSDRDRNTLRKLYEKPIGARVVGAKRAY